MEDQLCQLKLSEKEARMHLNILIEACCYLMPRKTQEGFWIVDNLLEQIRNKAIPIFEAKFFNAMAVFAFDNSTNHEAYTEDALIAARMNLNLEETNQKCDQQLL
ncbi:23870_t:CDS:2 [Cetraspora pellucida]|uniref:23870_t:CDS:1 n=1 Tax=Cetraspora pellucida TaxID=1433469 RepID=A0A9N9IC66_9GLOM|nr:23870_t:CDS:2 [Cetraspora pellucida]